MKISTLIERQVDPFCSLEFFPPKKKEEWNEFYTIATRLKEAKPLFVSITYGAGGGTQNNTLEIAAHLQKVLNFETMVHLTCVKSNAQKIIDFMTELTKAGIQNILALRGDPPAGENFDWTDSEFQHASDLVTFIRNNFPNFCIGVAAYPYPHPESPSFKEDRRFTRQKIMAGANLAITQLMFDIREYFELADKLSDLNITVIPGILPVTSIQSLRRTLSMCGASIPGKLYFELEEADKKGGAEVVKEIGTNFAIEQCINLLKGKAPGIHLYTLNKADTCLKIVNELRSKKLLG